jgi:putative drug exporter of the RND superfamily
MTEDGASLGLLLAVSLGSLGLQPLGFLPQRGIAFAISLVLDTFIVRIFYLPAALSLVSRRAPRPPTPSSEPAPSAPQPSGADAPHA